MITNIQIPTALRAALMSLSVFVFFASIGRCDEERTSADDLKWAIKNFYTKHYTRPLSYLGNPEMSAGRLQHVQRFEVKNSYTRRIEDEQFHFYDVAVEIKIPNTGGPPYGGIVTELLPLKFVKRGNSWYSSRNLETEIQELPNGSLSKDAVVCADNPVPKTSPAATPGYDWENRPGNARSMGATQEMIDEANGRKAGKSNANPPHPAHRWRVARTIKHPNTLKLRLEPDVHSKALADIPAGTTGIEVSELPVVVVGAEFWVSIRWNHREGWVNFMSLEAEPD
jgi:hypothetical protein